MTELKVFNNDRCCERAGCGNRAHFKLDDRYLCGTHSRQNADDRITLPERSKTQKMEFERKECERLEEEQYEAKYLFHPGNICLARLGGFGRTPKILQGYKPISPNAKGGHFVGSKNFLTLSPMKMGPLPPEMHKEDKGELGMKEVTNIENLHQGTKAYEGEAKKDEKKEQFVPTDEYKAGRDAMVYDPEPHRHKPSSEKKNEPLCSFWILPDGKPQAVTYIESRARYCFHYEHFARLSDEFKQLVNWHQDGYHLQICGFDAFEIPEVKELPKDSPFKDRKEPKELLLKAQSFYNAMRDDKHPFGHERVLYALLTLPRELLPWYQTPFMELLKQHGLV
jgi:hypothetical protein